jgi:transcription antitermination factor NusA-like protein
MTHFDFLAAPIVDAIVGSLPMGMIDTPRQLILLTTPEQTAKFIGKGGYMRRKLEDRLEKQVVVLELDSQLDNFLAKALRLDRFPSAQVRVQESKKLAQVIVPHDAIGQVLGRNYRHINPCRLLAHELFGLTNVEVLPEETVLEAEDFGSGSLELAMGEF